MFSVVKVEYLNQLVPSMRGSHLSLLITILERLVNQFVYWKSPNISLYFEIDDFSSKKYTHTHTHISIGLLQEGLVIQRILQL